MTSGTSLVSNGKEDTIWVGLSHGSISGGRGKLEGGGSTHLFQVVFIVEISLKNSVSGTDLLPSMSLQRNEIQKKQMQ